MKPKEFVPYKNGFTFKDFYIQYGRYHFDPTNNILHVIGIPLITCTLQTICSEVDWYKVLGISRLLRQKSPEDFAFENTRNDPYDPVVWFWVGLCSIYGYLDLRVGLSCLVVGLMNYLGMVGLLIQDRKT